MAYRSALITGASSGIGEAFARSLAPETDLVLTGRDAQRLDDLRRAIDRFGRRVRTIVADLATDAGRTTVIAAAEAASIDLLINNAGLGTLGPVVENDPTAERSMVEVNVLAPVVLTRALLPGMLSRGSGAGRLRPGVIILASTAGFLPLPRLCTYAATKAFDLHYAEALSEELDGQADVLAVCPGPVRTRFGERAGMGDFLDRHGVPPDRVAADAMAALGRRRVVVIGAANRGASLAPRLMPRALVRYVAGRYMERRF